MPNAFGFFLPRILLGNNRDNELSGGRGSDFIFGFGGNDRIFGNAGSDYLFGGWGNDRVSGGRGDDYVNGGWGNDHLFGGSGNDTIIAGHGDDKVSGGKGDDMLYGGAGADKFAFNPNRAGEGDDVIKDFELGTDFIVLKATDILLSSPGLFGNDGDASTLSPDDLDLDDRWNLSASENGNLLVTHPNGTIEIEGLPFSDGVDSFSEILPALEIKGLVQGDDQANTLDGKGGDDLVNGLGGDDFLEGGKGNDILVGGPGADDFFFNPNRIGEGDDIIADFELGSDRIALNVNDVLASTPGLTDADGVAGFAPTDLDASELWDIVASENGKALVVHPNGTIELQTVDFDESLTFDAIFDASINLIVPEPEPVVG